MNRNRIGLILLLLIMGISTAGAIAPPDSSFTSDYTGGISPLLVNFTDTSTNTPAAWAWYYTRYTPAGNNPAVLFSSAQNPRSVPFPTGTWSIQLKASNAAGGTNTTARSWWVNVSNAPARVSPVPAFSANTTTGAVPLTVRFTDSSVDNILGWKWTFGDGSTSTASNPVHTYTTTGIYTVSLEVVNVSGYTTTTKTGFITARNSPVANFTGFPLTGHAPLEVTFTDFSTGPGITAWNWNFGDGIWENRTTSTNPVHTYAPGIWYPTLTVTDPSGSSTTLVTPARTITVIPLVPPVASFTPNATSGTAPLTVKFMDTSSHTPTVWNWSFRNVTPGNNTEVWFSTIRNRYNIWCR